MIHASNFEFNGICANDIGYTIVNFDGISTGEQDYEDIIVYNTSKASNNPQTVIHGSHTETPKTFSFQIMKNRYSSPTPILPAEQAFLKRWLEKKDGYHYLHFPEKGYDDIYYYCTINVKWYKIGSEIYGATLYVTCDSANAYSGIQSFEIKNFSNGATFQIYNDSDDVGQIEMLQIEIVTKGDGNIYITNNMDLLYSYREDILSMENEDDLSMKNKYGMSIKNCKHNETIIINGITKQIKSVRPMSSHTYLFDDYNYNPLHLINMDSSVTDADGNRDYFADRRINVIKNEGIPCDLSFAYRTIRTGVI